MQFSIDTEGEKPMIEVLKKMKAVYAEDQLAYLVKDMQVDAGRRQYKAISEEMVLEIIRPAFVKHGLIMVPHKIDYAREGNITSANVTFRIYDTDSGEFIEVACIGQGSDTQDKGAGMAMTYAQKHAFLKTFNIISGDDPDKVSSWNRDQEDAARAEKPATSQEIEDLFFEAVDLAAKAGVKDKFMKPLEADRAAGDAKRLKSAITHFKQRIETDR